MADIAARIAVLPTPGMGHLIPLVEFAKKLYRHHNIATTFIIPSDAPLTGAQKTFISTLPAAIDYILLPHVDLSDLPSDANVETRIFLTLARSLPALNYQLESLHKSRTLSALVVDQFGSDAFGIALGLNIPVYIFFPCTAMVLSLIFHLPVLDETVSCEFRDVEEMIRIPGCVPVHGRDLIDPIQDRKSDVYKWILNQIPKWRGVDGIMVNTFQEIEPNAIESLTNNNGVPRIYPIGPLTTMGCSQSDRLDQESVPCLKWLDQQPENSVLYISFGSGGALSYEQTLELAHGLQLSKQKFLWVMRCPNNTSSNANFFAIQNTDDPLSYLPQGFLQVTKDQGLIVPFWAPQAEILSHSSTGGFLTHCGWNSSLESIVNGVPMIAWPLYAEQKMNAVMLDVHVKVALRPVTGENAVVGRDEVASVVEKLMMEGSGEGEGVRKRAREMKKVALEAVSGTGSSARSLADLAAKWKKTEYGVA